MNSHHNNGENDKLLNEDLDKLGHSYSGLRQDEPPDLLDQAVLNSAHRAVEKKPHWMKFSWVHGLTTAAVFVLALSLIINQREPSPATPEGLDLEYPTAPRLDARARKQSADIKTDVVRQEPIEINAGRSDGLTNTAAGAMDDAASRTLPVDTPETQKPKYAEQVLQAEPSSIDEADQDGAEKAEEAVMQKVSGDSEPEETGGRNEFREGSAIAASPAVEPGESKEIDTVIEARLLAIIKLKQDDDERWKTELAAFVENHPDYPLPEELVD